MVMTESPVGKLSRAGTLLQESTASRKSGEKMSYPNTALIKRKFTESGVLRDTTVRSVPAVRMYKYQSFPSGRANVSCGPVEPQTSHF